MDGVVEANQGPLGTTDAYFAEEKQPFVFKEPTPTLASKAVRVGSVVLAKGSRWVTYGDGRFEVEGLRPIGMVEIRTLDAAGKFHWVSAVMKDWFYALPVVSVERSAATRRRDALLAAIGILLMGVLAYFALSSQPQDSATGTALPPYEVLVDGKTYYVIQNKADTSSIQRGDKVRVEFVDANGDGTNEGVNILSLVSVAAGK